MLELDKIYNMDCIEGMKQLDSNCIDMILCDLPYGVTARNKWDIIIPFDKLWKQYERIIKDNGAIVFTATEPFSSELIVSNKILFRYDLIWKKPNPTGFLNSNRMPLRGHEQILIFYKKLPIYNPQMTDGRPYKANRSGRTSINYQDTKLTSGIYDGKRYPISVIKFQRDKEKLHPTQKPLALFEYLIKTYTNENDLVLDNCMGSGTTAVACKQTNRRYIGFEISKEYCDIANKRLDNVALSKKLGEI